LVPDGTDSMPRSSSTALNPLRAIHADSPSSRAADRGDGRDHNDQDPWRDGTQRPQARAGQPLHRWRPRSRHAAPARLTARAAVPEADLRPLASTSVRSADRELRRSHESAPHRASTERGALGTQESRRPHVRVRCRLRDAPLRPSRSAFAPPHDSKGLIVTRTDLPLKPGGEAGGLEQ
jgi:hypothetical protein